MQTHPPDPNAITSINPPKTLLSLPKELMTDICSGLDQKSAISLLYVHRSFHQPAESRIYRDITLSIPTYWGEPVLVRPPHLHYGTGPYIEWAKKQAKEVEMAGRAEARRRAEEMIMNLSKGTERWRYIRKLIIEPRLGANNAIVQILSLARQYITEIIIVTSRKHIYRSGWAPKTGETLWAKLADFGPFETYTFPNLRSVSIDLEDYDCCSSPGYLIDRATGLQVIKLNGGHAGGFEHERPDDGDEDCECASWADFAHSRKPMLASLRSIEVAYAANEYEESPPRLFRRCLAQTGIIELNINIKNASTDEDGTEWLEDILLHPSITHLEYKIPAIPIREALEALPGTEDAWPVLRSLIHHIPILGSADERLQKLNLLSYSFLSGLKKLGMRVDNKSTKRITGDNQYTPFCDYIHQAQALPEDSAQQLLVLKSLEVIQFMSGGPATAFVPVQKWEIKGVYGIIIRSLERDGSILLHTRTYSRSVPRKFPEGSDAEQTYTTSKFPQWEDATYWDGLTVPLWVLSEMKRVEGEQKPWVGRGIKVGKKAWQVLLDWKEKYYPETTEAGTDSKMAEGAEAANVEYLSDSEDDLSDSLVST